MSISIPKPCTENWSSMHASGKGRHCVVCDTEVVDFTNWKTEDIFAYIQQSTKSICARITQESLEEMEKSRKDKEILSDNQCL